MDTSAKWLVLATIPALQVTFLRYFVHFFWVMVLYLPRHGFALTRSKVPRIQILRACLLFSGTALNFTGLKYLPLTTAIAFFFAAPMVVCLLSIPILKEQVGIKRFAAIVVGFIGVLVIVAPWNDSFDYHVFFAIGATLCVSGYFVLSRVVAGIDSNAVTQFYCSAVPTLVMGTVILSIWEWPSSSLQWSLLLLIGTLGMLGHSVLTLAHKYAEASVLAPTVYSQIIYITILGWLVFEDVPTASTVVGISIIVASGVYIWRRERILQAERNPLDG